MTSTLELSKALIARQSVTPDDQGCQALLIDLLKQAGFTIKDLSSGDVSNFYASHGAGEPHLIFAGHTDVVPPGPLKEWTTPPFKPTIKDGMLYGRGAADMKSAVAAMTLAITNFVTNNPNHSGTIGLAITSDEEGPATDGTIKIIDYLAQQKIIPDYVVVGEASSNKTMGDAIKIGRRGSMHGKLTIIGKQGHIAYPQKANNPIHACFKALNKLAETQWDKGNQHFSPSSFQFFDIQSGIGASNVIPGTLTAKFNIRFSPMCTPQGLKNRIERILKEHRLNYDIDYNVSSEPYFSGECTLSKICQQSIKEICNIDAELNTLGGTSDGRHFAPHGAQVVELGVCNKTIHKINECAAVSDIEKLQPVYEQILKHLMQ